MKRMFQWAIRDWIWLVILIALAANSVRLEFRIVEIEESHASEVFMNRNDRIDLRELDKKHRRDIWDHFVQLGLQPPTPVRP